MADKIYLIPGLGFNKEIFSRLELPSKNLENIEYINPLKGEKLQQYVSRLIKINLDASDSITLIGHSFGGLIAQEIAMQIPIKKIILISSIKSKNENPFHFKIIAKLGLHRFFSKKWILKTFRYWAGFHGYDSTASKKIFIKMIGVQNNEYLKWALYQLSIWKGTEKLETPIIHLHGDDDKTFPIKLIRNPIVIKNGTHVMVFNKAKEISKLVNDLVAENK